MIFLLDLFYLKHLIYSLIFSFSFWHTLLRVVDSEFTGLYLIITAIAVLVCNKTAEEFQVTMPI